MAKDTALNNPQDVGILAMQINSKKQKKYKKKPTIPLPQP
jgi:hypothetical protein